MRLTLTRSGGLLGTSLPPTVLDTAALSSSAREHFESLVVDSGFFQLSEKIQPGMPQADRFQYDLEVRDGSRVHQVSFPEQSAPDALLRLVMDIQGGRR